MDGIGPRPASDHREVSHANRALSGLLLCLYLLTGTSAVVSFGRGSHQKYVGTFGPRRRSHLKPAAA